METELAKYDAACRALTEARPVNEGREILNFAEAQRAYARMAKNRNLEADAFEIRGSSTGTGVSSAKILGR